MTFRNYKQEAFQEQSDLAIREDQDNQERLEQGFEAYRDALINYNQEV